MKHSQNSAAMIEARGLCKTYGKTEAVRSLELTVWEGEIFALLGLNGAGKTTTIRMLTGLTNPTGGSASLCGFPIGSPEMRALVGLSPQENSAAPGLTVRENLRMTAAIYGIGDAPARTEELIRRMNLTEHADKRAKHLSGGLLRRLSIGMSLVTEPKVLFLDEPTLGLDVLARRELWKLIRELRSSMTVVLTTHYMEEAETLADRIAIMAEGRILVCGTLSELRQSTGSAPDADLESIFLKLAGGCADEE